MKIRLIVISLVVLLVIIGLALFLRGNRGTDLQSLPLAQWTEFSEEELDSALEEVFSGSRLPEGQESDLLAWLFIEHQAKAKRLIRENHQGIALLPEHLSNSALVLVRARQNQTGLEAIALARELYPDNPNVLGVTGIIAYLGGRPEEARQLLERSEAWEQNIPIVDFYLGGILVSSGNTADQTRGKQLLMKVARGEEDGLQELAGLTLLTNPSIPMINEDLSATYTLLQERDTFRPENSNLNAEVLRIISNRLFPVMPEEALQIAKQLFEYPETTTSDRLALVQMAQSVGEAETARAGLKALEDDEEALTDAAEQRRFQRALAVQYFIDQSPEQGLTALQEIVQTEEPETDALQETFQTILRQEMPMEIERQVLEAYLELPVQGVTNSLQVLSRLVQIAPLNREQWTDYAMEHLFEREPLIVGNWLAVTGAGGVLIEALEEKPRLDEGESVLLVETYLREEDYAKAQTALNTYRGTIEAPIWAYLQCRVFIGQGNIEQAMAYWEESRQGVMGSNRFPLLKNLGFLALDLDQPVNAMQALYTAFSAGISFNVEQAGQLLNLTLAYGSLRQSTEVAEYLARIQPDSAVAQNNLAYFHFLADSNVEDSVDRMRELVEEYPEIHQFKLTLALGLIKSGRTNEANRLIRSANINLSDISNRGRLIYAIVLAATDQRVAAAGLIQNLDLDELIPEEKALLEAF